MEPLESKFDFDFVLKSEGAESLEQIISVSLGSRKSLLLN